MRTTMAIIVLASAATCGGDDPSPASPTPVTTAQVTHLAINGAATVVELQGIQLAANAHRDGGAAPIDVTARATWTTGDPHAATVAQGLVTGENRGTVTITAEYDGKTVEHQVTVTRREPPLQCFVDPVTDTAWGLEKSVGPTTVTWMDVEVSYRLRNDCASRVRTSLFDVQVWANPERTGQRISTGFRQDIGSVDFPPGVVGNHHAGHRPGRRVHVGRRDDGSRPHELDHQLRRVAGGCRARARYSSRAAANRPTSRQRSQLSTEPFAELIHDARNTASWCSCSRSDRSQWAFATSIHASKRSSCASIERSTLPVSCVMATATEPPCVSSCEITVVAR